MSTTLLDQTLVYAKRQPIVPVDADKRPLVPLADATQKASVIEEWFAGTAPAGVAFRTDRLAVIDVAEGADDHLASVEARLGPLPATREQRTPTGGRHLIFRRPRSSSSLAPRQLAPGISLITGPERYVIVAPSRNGVGAYEWVKPVADLADLPRNWARDTAEEQDASVLPDTDSSSEALGSWAPKDLTALDVDPAVVPEIGTVLYRGLRHLVSGEPETLKGWLLLVLTLGELRAGHHVFWIDFEQGIAMTIARLRDIGASVDDLDRFHYIEPREPLTDEKTRSAFVQLVADTQPTLAVFDAYAGLIGLDDGDPNAERDIERVNRRYLDPFRHVGAATVAIDHPVKNVGERGRYSGGSGRKLAEVDVHLRLDRGQPFGRGRTGTATIRVLKDRPGGLPHPAIGTLALTSDPDTGSISWEIRAPETAADGAGASSFRPTGYMEKVSLYLEIQTAPVSRNQVETTVTGKAPVIRTALDHLTHEGYVVETRGQRGARLVRSEKPYREARDEVGTRSTSEHPGERLDLVPRLPHETASLDLVPPRPHLVPTSSQDEDDDFVPRSPPLRGDEDEVGAGELEELLARHADIAENGE